MNWKNVENKLMEISDFLKQNLEFSPYTQNDPIQCHDCLLKMTSILIASDKIELNKLRYEKNNLWRTDNENNYIKNKKGHGAKWHHNMMENIENYFNLNNCNVYVEPNLHYGRADLYVHDINTYIEVGSVNLYKLYLNLYFMNDCKILIVPSEYYSLEFIL